MCRLTQALLLAVFVTTVTSQLLTGLIAPAVTDAPPTSRPEVCSYPSNAGFCRGYFPKFFYNDASMACEQFIYGGCGGNDNRFETKDACVAKCMS